MPVLTAPSALRSGLRTIRTRRLGLLIVLAGWLICLVLAYRDRDVLYHGIDFTSFYSCTRCLIAGCNPYDHAAAMQQFLEQGGSLQEAGPPPLFGPFIDDYAGYPAIPMVYAMPLALLRWPLALYVWLGIGIAVYTVAIWLAAAWVSEFSPVLGNVCLAIFVMFGRLALDLANPALIAAALGAIGVLLILRDRRPWVGVVCYAASLVLKPHLSLLLLLYFLLANARLRRRVFEVVGIAVLISLPAALWVKTQPASRHWMRDYAWNLRDIALPGHLSDPGPTNPIADKIADLQTVASLVRNDPAWYNHVVWAFSGVLLLAWLVPVLRLRPSLGKDLVAVAGLACYSLLPYYHRSYDTRVLLVAFPGMAWLMARFPRCRWVVAAASVLMAFWTTDDYDRWIARLLERWDGWLDPLRDHLFWQMTVGRPVCNSILVMTVVLFGALWVMARRERSESA
jgi:hypothetical protein